MFPTTLSAFKVYGNNEGSLSPGVNWKSDYSMSLTDMISTITFGDLTIKTDSSCSVSTAEILGAIEILPLSVLEPL